MAHALDEVSLWALRSSIAVSHAVTITHPYIMQCQALVTVMVVKWCRCYCRLRSLLASAAAC